MNPKLLPDRMLRLISRADRKWIGVWTLEERMQKLEIKNERDLGNQIVQYLNLRNIEVLRPRTDKKSRIKKGWPDLTFCVRAPNGFPLACAFELKTDSGVLTKEQADMLDRLKTAPNAWHVRVIRSLIEVVDFLREIGL